MKNMLIKTALLLAAASLAACGGGDGEAPPPAPLTAVPASATASTQAFVAFVNGDGAAARAEPLEVDGVTPPTSETEEPVDIP